MVMDVETLRDMARDIYLKVDDAQPYASIDFGFETVQQIVESVGRAKLTDMEIKLLNLLPFWKYGTVGNEGYDFPSYWQVDEKIVDQMVAWEAAGSPHEDFNPCVVPSKT